MEAEKYDLWNKQKKLLARKSSVVYFHERDVLYARLGVNLGFEQNGKGGDFRRPVLVLRKFSKRLAIIVPLTSVSREGEFYFSFVCRGIKSCALLSQVRPIDTSRFTHKIGRIEKPVFLELKKKLREVLKL